jgi:hypothetical protein
VVPTTIRTHADRDRDVPRSQDACRPARCRSGRPVSDASKRLHAVGGRVAAFAGGRRGNGSRVGTGCGRAAYGLCCRPATRPLPGRPTVSVSAKDRQRKRSADPGVVRIDRRPCWTNRQRWNRPRMDRLAQATFGVTSDAGTRWLGRSWALVLIIRYRGVVSGMGPIDCNRRGHGARLCRTVFARLAEAEHVLIDRSSPHESVPTTTPIGVPARWRTKLERREKLNRRREPNASEN